MAESGGQALSASFRREVAVSGAIRLASLGLAFLFFVVLSRATTPEIFGVFSAAYSLATLLSYAANVGQHVAILRFWPALDETYGPAVASAALRIGLLLTLLGGLVLGLIVMLLGLVPAITSAFGGAAINLVWTGILLFACAVAEFSASALRAQGSLVLALAPRDIIWRVVVIAGALLAAPLAADAALGLVAVTLLVICLPQVALLIREIWRYRFTALPATEAAKLRSATWGLWASTSVTPVMVHATTVIVAVTLGPIAAGAYFAADRLAKLLAIALEGIEKVSGPMLSRSYHAGRMEEVLTIVAGTSALAFSVAIVGALGYLFLGSLALALFDPLYVEYYPVLLVLVVGQLVNTACGSNAMLLNMAGRERDLLVIRLIWGAASMIVVYFASIWFGIVGSAIASTAVMIGWNATAVVVCQLRLGILPMFSPAAVLTMLRRLRGGART